ncbi:MAG TPA: outer membrane lipoprotein carrier protein LolA [Vicinamibacterales bacterium]|nr:outer membrane lipoprotein carrier protein LolA [Vicinamibacterales bacterium]
MGAPVERAVARLKPLRYPIARALAALAAACVLSPTLSSAPPATFDELYAKARQMNDGLKTLTARFTETTTSTLLTKPLVARGRVAVERPSRVLLRYTQPDARTILIDGNRMTVVWPSRNLYQVTDISTTQGRIQRYFVNGTAADLRHEFQIDDRPPGGERPNAYYLSMAPKRKQIRESLARLDLWIDRVSLLLAEMTMTFANGDTKTMTFDEVVKNAPLEPGTFSLER